MRLHFRKNSPYYPLLSGNDTNLFQSGKLDDVFRTEFFRRLKPIPPKETLPDNPANSVIQNNVDSHDNIVNPTIELG